MNHNWEIVDFSSYKNKVQRDEFDCGNHFLNQFIKKQASQYEKANYAKIYLAVEVKKNLFGGYYSLSSNSVLLSYFPPNLSKFLPKHLNVPVALLGRIAVHKSFQAQKLGSLLLLDAMDKTYSLSLQMGSFAIEVDAIDSNAKSFYSRFGFESLIDNDRHMFLPLKMVKKPLDK